MRASISPSRTHRRPSRLPRGLLECRGAGSFPVLIAGIVAGAAGGVTWRAGRDVPAVQWSGSRLGGPANALYPRVSPDGQLVAFLAVVDDLTQLAVTKPGAVNWTVLTKDRTKGLIDSLAWAQDGSRIYYDRLTDVHNGIYSVPALGGDERLLIENASAPVPLADGSLLLLRRTADRLTQLHRLWPDSGQLTPLPAVTDRGGYTGPVREIDAGRIAFFGRPIADAAKADQLYVLALDSGAMTRLGAELAPGAIVSMSVSKPDRSVLAAVRDGSVYRVLRIPFEGSHPVETVLTLLSTPWIDAGPDESIVVGLSDRPTEVLHFRQGSSIVERSGDASDLLERRDRPRRQPLPDHRARGRHVSRPHRRVRRSRRPWSRRPRLPKTRLRS